MKDDKWPADDEARLKELASTGLSNRAIGLAMGRTSGSISGKLNRIKGYRVPRVRKPKVAKAPRAPKAKQPRVVAAKPVSPPVYGPVLVHQLNDNHCRWPLWGTYLPKEEERFYCGAPADGAVLGFPYCREHTHVAYRAAQVPTGRGMIFPWQKQ